MLAANPAPLPEYFSWLRDRTELWVGREFAELRPYHATFRSCNKAFYTERARRFAHWCGQCDKCCFIDLILAPFLPADALRRDLRGRRASRWTIPRWRPSSGRCSARAPSRSSASARSPSAGRRCCWPRGATTAPEARLLQELAAEVAGWPDAPSEAEVAAMLGPVGRNFIPDRYR